MASYNSLSKNWMRDFLPVWIAQAFSLLGSGLVQFALVWWLTQKTNSATVLATATLVAILPEVILGPFAGALVDRWNRKMVMMVADGSIALFTAFLGFLYWGGHIQIWHIYVLMFMRGLGGSFQFAALQASISLMVPDEHLARVAGINQSLRGALGIATPPMAALLLTLLPMYGILSIDVTTAILAISILFIIRIPQPTQVPDQGRVTVGNVLTDVRLGFRYILAWRGMFALLMVAVALNFFGYPTSVLQPLLITRHFGGGAWQLSAMESVLGFGVVAGGLLLGVWGGFKRKIYTSITGLIVEGLAFILVAAAPANAFILALIGMAVVGLMNAMVNGPIFALVQARVAPEMQGRVFTLIGSMASAMGPLSMILAGPFADKFGIRSWYWLTAITSVLIGLGCFLIPSLIHIEDGQPARAGLPDDLVPQETGD